MPTAVTCPVCGSDGTSAANEVIAFSLATELTTQNCSRNGVMVFAAGGCVVAGLVGAIKALTMTGGFDVLLCLLGSTGAFGMALAVYFWKR